MTQTNILSLSSELSNRIVQNLLEVMLQEIPIGNLVMCYTDEWPDMDWQSVLSREEDGNNNALYYALIEEIRSGEKGDELLKELFKPLLAEKLAETLGAKEVIINW